jgi:hypothetical protein
MLERSKKQQLIVNTLIISSVLSIVILAGLLIWQASLLSAVEAAVNEKFAIGPMNLFELGKVPLNGGYQATIGFLPGTATYFAIWALLAVVFILIKLVKGQSFHKE